MRLLYGPAIRPSSEVMRETLAAACRAGQPRADRPGAAGGGRERAGPASERLHQGAGLPSGRGDAGVLLRLGAVSEGLPEALQPGVHVRRVGDRSLTDEEMTAYYSPLAHQHGGRLIAQYRNAICLVMDDDHVYAHQGEELCGDRFYLLDTPHPSKEPPAGLPAGRAFGADRHRPILPDLPQGVTQAMVPGFVAFFRRSLTRTRPERLEEGRHGDSTAHPGTALGGPGPAAEWDGPLIASKGRLFDGSGLPGFVALEQGSRRG